jgi:hypothetical protein
MFAAVLAAFWVLDTGAWAFILRRTAEPTVNDSVHGFRDKLKWYDRLESLLAFDEQHRGSWKWWRQGVGLLLLGFINLLAFSPLSESIGEAIGGIPGDTIVALSILIFVVAMEGWIWFTRIQSKARQHAISDLAKKYNLSPKTPITVSASTSAPALSGSEASAKITPIISCACGKKLKVPDSLAGKKVKCPSCQAADFVPPKPSTK